MLFGDYANFFFFNCICISVKIILNVPKAKSIALFTPSRQKKVTPGGI